MILLPAKAPREVITYDSSTRLKGEA